MKISLNEELFEKYPFLKICEYCKFLNKIYYNQSLVNLDRIFQLFNEEETCEDDYKLRLIQSVELSKYILFHLPVQPDNLVLTGRASVQFEYEYLNSYLEIEVYSDKLVCLILPNRNSYQIFYRLELNIFEIHKLFIILENFFYGRDNKIYISI